MTAWATIAVPAGSALVGTCIGAGFTLWGQALTDRRILHRERESRREAFTLKEFELEREFLISLYDSLMAHFEELMLCIHLPSEDPRKKERAPEFLKKASALQNLTGRTTSMDLTMKLTHYMHAAAGIMVGETTDENQVIENLTKAQLEISKALKRNPYDAFLGPPEHPKRWPMTRFIGSRRRRRLNGDPKQ